MVGYDASADADAALEWAARSAEDGQPLLLVLVGTDLDPVVGHVREDTARTLEQWRSCALERLEELGVVHSEVRVVRGPTVPELLRAATEAELLVVGSRGRGLAKGTFAGSVSQHAARHARCPVVVVRPTRSARARRIVVGVDGSVEAERALDFACRRATRTGERVDVVHGHHAYSTWTGADALDSPAVQRRMREAELLTTASVARAAADFPGVEISPVTAPVPPARLLVDASAAASLVVVGSRGRDAFAELLLGSVSQHVLQHAECPVAIVR